MKPEYIPWILSVLSLLIAYVTLTHNLRKDEKTEDSKTASKFDGLEKSVMKLDLMLHQVCSNTAETRTDIKGISNDVQEVKNRVTILEQSVKSAHKRIDDLKGEVSHE